MKRILSLFMVFVMVLSLAPVTALAADGPSITATANKSEAAIGDTIEVTVSLAGNPGFNDADLMLTFDRDILQFTGLKTVEFNGMQLIDGLFASGTTETNTTVGNENYGAVLNARTEPVSTNGNLFTALFTVIGAGNTTVDVTVNALRNTANDGAITDHTASIAVTPSASIAVADIPATAVTLSKTELSLEEGNNYLLSATVAPDNTTDEVVWSSSNDGVATVVNGQVRAIAPGTATITAKANDEAYAECVVNVTAEQSIVRVGSTTAEMTGVKSLTVGGSTKTVKNIYKLPMNGHEDTMVYITGSSIMGAAYKLDGTPVIGVPYGADLSQIPVNGTWASANTADLLVTEEALTAAVGADVSKLGLSADKLYAFLYTEDSGANRNCGLLFEIEPVTATGVEVQETMSLYEGETGNLSVSVLPAANTDDLTVTYRSASEAVATVDANGKVTGVAPGTAVITVTAGDYTDTCTVTVKSGYVEIENIPGNGDTWKGSVTGITIKDVTVDSYQWNEKTLNVYIADDTATATVIFNFNKNGYDNKHEETAAITGGAGTLTKTFNYNDGWEGYDITWVVNFMKSVPATSIELNKTTLELTKGSNATLTATLSEGSTDTVTWSSSDESVATVDASGKVTAVGGGTATITATAHEGLTATCTVNVPTLYSVQNIPQVPTFKYGKFEIASLEIDAKVESAAWDGDTLNVVLAEGTTADASISTIWTVNAQNTWFAQDDAHYFFNDRQYGYGTPVTDVHTLVATLTDGAGTATATFEGRGADCCDDQACDLSFPAKTYTVNFTVASDVDTPSGDDSSSVTVTLSLSTDEKFMVGRETDEIMAFKNITVPYFDLANYGLEEYYFVSESYGDDGDGLPGSDLEPGTAEYAEGKVTLLHLYLYALERFYCGVPQEEVGQGYLYDEGLIGTDVISVSGGVGSIFLNQFWGGDCNLNYYVNYEYPLASEGWGATADQILLRDGDMITLGHFSGWSFYADPYSIFNYITADNAAPKQGGEVTLTLYYAGPNMGTTSSDTAQNLNTYCLDVYYTPVDSPASEDVTDWDYLGTSDENGQLVVDTSELEPDKYIVAVPGQYGVDYSDEICSTPGGMILTVTAAAEDEECEHEFANGSCIHCGEPDPAFVPITGLALSSASTKNGALALVAGGSEKLNVTITPVHANQGYSWSSDNEDVATVNNGIVTAVGAGTAIITVTAGDAATFAAKSTPVTASVTVTVTEPAAGYTVKMPGDATVNAGQTIDIPVTLGSTDNAAYNAFDITVTYPAALTLTTTELDGLDVTAGEGSVRIKGYGEAKDAGAAPFTLRFEAAEVGEHSVTVTAAKVDNSTGAIDADAPDAALIDAVTVITVTGYNVSLPENFTGEKVAAPNEDYSFAPPADNYNYTVTVTVGGEEVEVTPNDDGSYTIPAEQVTGEIVVTMERTGKEYSVTFTGEDMTGNPKAYYDAAYSATLTPAAGYNYSVSIKINGDAYSGHSIADNVYTIPGKDITGDIEFIVTKTLIPVTMHSITFTGDAAGCAPGNTEVKDGSDYSFQLSNTEVGYTYTVTVGGEPLTADETGKYTVKNIKADTEIVITKALAAETTVEVKGYVTKDGGEVKLVLVKGDLAEGKVFAYNGEPMYYSEQYQAWAYLDIAAGTEAFTAETARAKVSTVPGVVDDLTIAQTFDVNGSEIVDINDAQLAYDIYKPEMYTDFNTVSVLKFLNADVNGSYSVTTEDAAAVVAAIQ